MNGSRGNGLWGFLVIGLTLIPLAVLLGVPLLHGQVLMSGDAPYHGIVNWKRFLPEGFLGVWYPNYIGLDGHPLHLFPHGPVLWAVPDDLAQVLLYAFDTLLTAIACFVFLRARGLAAPVAVAPSVGMAFSGYGFTLISAGHVGHFAMVPCALFALTCLERALRGDGIMEYAAAGVLFAVAFKQAEDVAFLFAMLLTAYALFRLARRIADEGSRGARPIVLRAIAGGAIGALLFLVVAASMFVATFTQILPGRQSVAGQTPAQKWEFATNWSMPPEEVQEFVVPGVYGWQTGDPERPYWGRLGRVMGWETGRQGFANFRQHTVYLGLPAVFFMAMALAGLRRRKGDATWVRSPEVVFWSAAWVIAVLLAMGRHAPFYRLFYSLPHADVMRAPVKFLHVAEVCTAVLFAFGLERFVGTSVRQPIRKRWLVACLALSGLAVLASVWAAASPGMLVRQWNAMGLAGKMEALARGTSWAYIHAALVGGALAVMLEWARRGVAAGGSVSRPWFAALGLLLAADSTVVAWPYVRAVVADRDRFYARNALLDDLAGMNAGDRVTMPVRDGVAQFLSAYSFMYHGVPEFDPSLGGSVGLPADYRSLFDALARRPDRLWQLAAARHVFLPAESAGGLTTSAGFEVVRGYRPVRNAWGGLALETVPVGQASHVYLRYTPAPSRAHLVHEWEAMDAEAMLKRLATSGVDLRRTCLVEPGSIEGLPSAGAAAAPPAQVTHLAWNAMEVECSSVAPGILVTADRWSPEWRVEVDGAPAKLLRCNYIQRGVALAAGNHRVRFTFRSKYAVLSGLGYSVFGLTLLGWIGTTQLRRVTPDIRTAAKNPLHDS